MPKFFVIFDVQDLWLPLLNRLIGMPETGSDLLQCIQTMLLYVDPARLINTLLEGGKFASGQYGELAPLLRSVFDTYDYQEVLQSSVNNLLRADEFRALDRLRRSQVSGIRCQPLSDETACELCNEKLDTALIIFACDSKFHVKCLNKEAAYRFGPNSEREYFCPKCRDGPQANPALHKIGQRMRRSADEEPMMAIVTQSFNWMANQPRIQRVQPLELNLSLAPPKT